MIDTSVVLIAQSLYFDVTFLINSRLGANEHLTCMHETLGLSFRLHCNLKIVHMLTPTVLELL
jgi:hypothetical protein